MCRLVVAEAVGREPCGGGALSEAEAHSLRSAVEDLYRRRLPGRSILLQFVRGELARVCLPRRRLPGLSVIQESQGGGRHDFLVDR